MPFRYWEAKDEKDDLDAEIDFKLRRLDVIYTPNEIVRFMMESADYLCEKHFRRNLIDKCVEILDPAAGTGAAILTSLFLVLRVGLLLLYVQALAIPEHWSLSGSRSKPIVNAPIYWLTRIDEPASIGRRAKKVSKMH